MQPKRKWDMLQNLFMNPFLFAVGAWSIVFGIRSIMDAQSLPTIDCLPAYIMFFWALLYLAAGSLMLTGAMKVCTKALAAGCAMFSVAALLNASFIIFCSDFTMDKWPAVHLSLFGGAALIRLKHLLRGEVLLWVRKY
jgi:hypothetical protein